MGLFGLIWRCCQTGANGPNGLVGHGDLLDLFFGKSIEGTSKLAFKDGFFLPGLPLFKGFTDTEDRSEF